MNSKKSPIIWKINLSRKVPITSGIRVKNCQKKTWNKINFQSNLPDVFLKNTASESLFQSACNFVKKETAEQFFSYEFCEFSERLLLSIAIICQEHFKLNVRRIKATVVRRYSLKKMFLEILQNPQENTCARHSLLIKLQALGLQL